MIKYIIRFIEEKRLTNRIKRAVDLAQALSSVDHRKRLVLIVAGVPKVFTKQELQRLLLTRTFKKGTTIQDLEQKALIITQ